MATTKYSRRDFLRASAALAGAAALSACATPTPQVVEKPVEKVVTATPAPAKPVTVVWWRAQSGAIGDLLDKFAKGFSDANKGITVQAEFQGDYFATMTKLIAGAAANALPDMVLVGDGQYPPLARGGVFLPLDDMMKGPNGLDISNYKAPIKRGILNGKMYQLAYGVSTPIFYWNPQYLEEAGLKGAPDDWEVFFEEYLPKLTKPNRAGFVNIGDDWWPQIAYWTNGVMVNDENWEIDLANPKVITWFERMQKAHLSKQSYYPTAADGGGNAYFGNGLGAMMIQSTGSMGGIDTISEKKGFKAQCAFLPKGPGGRFVPNGGNGLSLVRGASAEVVAAGWKFIKYLHDPQQYAEYDKLTGYIPMTPDVVKIMQPLMEADKRRQVAIDQLQYSRWHMTVHSLARAQLEQIAAWNEIISTNVNVKDRLQKLQKTCVQIAKEEGFKPVEPTS